MSEHNKICTNQINNICDHNKRQDKSAIKTKYIKELTHYVNTKLFCDYTLHINKRKRDSHTCDTLPRFGRGARDSLEEGPKIDSSTALSIFSNS